MHAMLSGARRAALPGAVVVLALTLSACGDEPGAAETDATAAADTALDTGAGPLDGEAGADTGADAGVEDTADAEPDVAAPDTDDGGPDAEVDGGPSCPGAPGCACTGAGDCDNALCIDTPTGGQCAQTCVDACPAGFKCAPVNSPGGDSVTICVPHFAHLCDPCAASKDCQSLGLADSACVDQGPLGRFCGVGCTDDQGCPDGYGCQEVSTAEGASAKQCVRLPAPGSQGAFGTCPCSEAAVAAKLETACAVVHKDAEGQVIATCAGVRACLPAGLSACAAPEFQAESCDGVDNDCDGTTDETTCDDGNACTTDACLPAKGGCVHVDLDGTPCNADSSVCTENDSCKQGLCVPGAGKACDDGNPCTVGACEPASGCTQTNDDAKPCDADGTACTAGDICAGGQCQVGKLTTCDDTNPCTKDACDPLTGKCTYKPVPAGTPCTDGSACTEADACVQGECEGKAIPCDDGKVCTTDSCDPATGCAHVDNTAPCDDDNPCTVGDACSQGKCVKGEAKTCDSGSVCITASCSLQTGKCVYADAKAGLPCDDGNACTVQDGCVGGQCSGQVPGCDDDNPCTNDACDAQVGCAHTANVAACDDGNACTVGDGCQDKACVPGTPKVCADGEGCTKDSCDAKTGSCVFDGAALNGQGCDADGSVCTENDVCKQGVCAQGPAVVCDDGNVCTNDSCHKTLGCQKVPNTKPCDDGNACTANDVCSGGDCEAKPISCDDGNPCTDDGCDKAKGCTQLANDAPCNDGSACTTQDVCAGGTCQGQAITCDDGNVCTDDACDAKVGCAHVANTAPCSDGDACTEKETCKDKQCTTSPVVCDDGNPCTTDSCDAAQGCQVKNVADDTVCGQDKICKTGQCVQACVVTPSSQTFNHTGGMQTFTVPKCVKSITIEAWGAQGGKNPYCSQAGGKGARIKGTFAVTPESVLQVVVGGLGKDHNLGNTSNGGSSGGGGSFVWLKDATTPMLIAGGGGGGAICTSGGGSSQSPGVDGVTGPAGTFDRTNVNAGGSNGSDGSGQGGGKGWISVRLNPAGKTGEQPGGYGGGGEVSGTHSGGGGGGYSGGGAKPYTGFPAAGGGGGGSWNGGTSQDNAPGVQAGHGKVVISWQ